MFHVVHGKELFRQSHESTAADSRSAEIFRFFSRLCVDKSSAGAAACDNLFRFVSARDPEYYREFKKVSFNEEKKIKQNARKKEEQELTETYDKAVSNLSKATDIMGQIR